jgi:S1-C subfamily serine protease
MMRWFIGILALAAASAAQAASLSQSVVDKLASACVLIQVEKDKEGATGSGFFVNRTDVLTNCHVVKSALTGDAKVSIVLGHEAKGLKIAPAEIIAADDELDLALLRTTEKSSYMLTFLPEKSLRVTQAVWVAGFPFGAKAGLEVTMTAGTISSLRHDTAGKLEAVQVDAAVNPGNSGGPVIDDQGRVVGISRAVINPKVGSGMAIAIPCSVAKAFVDRSQKVHRRSEELHVSGRAIRKGLRIVSVQKVEEPWGTSVRVTVNGTRGVERSKPFTIEVVDPNREVLKRDSIDATDLQLHEEKTVTIRLQKVDFKDVVGCRVVD